MRERGQRSALRVRDVGMQQSETPYVQLVDQSAAREAGRLGRNFRQLGLDDGLGNQRGGVHPEIGQAPVVGKAPVEFYGVGIDQQLRRIEPYAALMRPDAVRAVTVAHADEIAGQLDTPVVAVPLHGEPLFAAVAKQAKFDLLCLGRSDTEVRGRAGDFGAAAVPHAASER